MASNLLWANGRLSDGPTQVVENPPLHLTGPINQERDIPPFEPARSFRLFGIWQTNPTPSMAAPSHRHQSSLEGLIDFSAAKPLFAHEQQRIQAVGRFHRIVDFSDAAEQPASRYGDGYNRPALVRLTFEYARSQKSKDRFLGAFFRSLAIGMLDDDNVNLSDDSVIVDFRSPLFGFAEFLMANFFLPRISLSSSLLTSY